MDTLQVQDGFTLRQATAQDAFRIRQIIYQVQNNPTALNWKRFTLAIDPAGRIIGCGQVKVHADGALELASLAVLPEWRGRGVARKIIEHLLGQNPGRIYLTCGSRLEPLYQKFGFRSLEIEEMTPYYKRLSRMAALFNRLTSRPDHLSVMRRN